MLLHDSSIIGKKMQQKRVSKPPYLSMIYDTRFMSPAQEFLLKNLFSAVDLSWRII